MVFTVSNGISDAPLDTGFLEIRKLVEVNLLNEFEGREG